MQLNPGYNPNDETEYEDLEEVISFEGFDFAKWYEHEDTILRPRMEALSFYAIRFKHGEYDSFGPLTRVCTAIDSKGNLRHFVYG